MTPFPSPAAAWFWTANVLALRAKGQHPPNPTADEVLRTLDRLYRRRKIELVHARILRIYGERQRAPNPAYPPERSDHRLWEQALNALIFPLKQKGIL